MAYRPQFAFPNPPKTCRDQNCMYSFDGTNTPSLLSIAAGEPGTNKIPLQLDNDADFLIRPVRMPPTALKVALEDCFLHLLVEVNPVNADYQLLNPEFWSESDGAGLVAWESDDWGIWCPAGGSLILYCANPTGAAITNFVVNLQGVKRYTGARCN